MMSRRDSRFRAPVALAVLALSVGSGCKKQMQKGAAQAQSQAPAAAADPQHSLIKNATFSEGSSLPWLTSFSAPAKGSSDVKDGALCLTMEDKGKNNWDAQLVQRPLVVEQGHSYTVDFRAWATAPTTIRPKLGMSGPPYSEYWVARLPVTTEPQRFQGQFVMGGASDATAEFSFHLAGPLAKSVPVTICLDDLYLDDPAFQAPPPE